MTCASKRIAIPPECNASPGGFAQRYSHWVFRRRCSPRPLLPAHRSSGTPPTPRLHPIHGCSSPFSRSEEHTSELQSLMRISYAVFCLKKKKLQYHKKHTTTQNTNIIY